VYLFWDAEGILFIDYLEIGKTITGEYYSNLLTKLDEKKNRAQRPGLQKKKIIFHQGQCTRPQKCLAMGKLRDLHYELLCWNVHPVPQIWLPLTSISSQNSTSSSLVSVFLRIKRRLQL
jgi:hypothetical protein